ncbi:MAG: hypothetical protein ACU0C9_06670 [Paracoccaceae bacterium]
MIDKKNILRFVSIVVIALSVGYFMQNGNALAERSSDNSVYANALSGAPTQMTPNKLSAFLPNPPVEAILPMQLLSPFLPGNRVTAVTFPINATTQSDALTPFFMPETCDLNMTALPRANAMVRLELDAPCYQNQRIMVSHAGLEFTDITGSDGRYSIDIPALNEFASFTVEFSDGRNVSAKTLGLKLQDVDRVAINWTGPPILHIHAMEFGAGFGDAGHVWVDSDSTAPGSVGFLTLLGNPGVILPKFAEIYTYQTGASAGNGIIEFTVEASITPQSCGAKIIGQSFQVSGDGNLAATSLLMSLPACGGENGYLVLNNLFQDLKIAQN